MNKFVIYVSSQQKEVALKVRADIVDIASKLGYIPIPINRVLTGHFAKGDIVLYPVLSNEDEKNADYTRVEFLKSLDVSLILVALDIDCFNLGNDKMMVEILNLADCLLIQNNDILSQLREIGIVTRVRTVEIHDYLIPAPVTIAEFSREVSVVNAPTKKYIKNWQLQTPINVFQEKIHEKDSLLNQVSELDPNKVNDVPHSGFGLVFEDDRANDKRFLNLSYEISMFLAGGVPVIISKHDSAAHLIRSFGLGLMIESLADIDRLMQDTTRESYLKMVENVSAFSKFIRQGAYYKHAIEACEHEVRLSQLAKTETKNEKI
ncbi:hypothetical protein H9L19_00780 [Weissella diestrammenae]|uniref:Glucosyltransferase 3-like C-terminal domain-containing protein n=1 Tax=Weissella diestrammenae TaxID=1162633 RepID=A0A7G9T5U7_9LACO|nr:hypothetical protein [Weissella diestrammenae]MCM0582302.1 hypothetical protein [Weissella diestrammenae]QNN75472.1 hypothetical protein H9L19_00780 [Weissella diestrammenae]